METIKIQLSSNNIKTIKNIGSFAKVVNTLVETLDKNKYFKEVFIKELEKKNVKK